MELRAVRRTTAEIEEERRLLYVAMTRAKDDLHLVVPHRFSTHRQRRKATGMSMRRGRASSRIAFSISSRWAPGLSRQRRPPRVPSQGVRVDLSAPMRGCGGEV